MPSGEGVEILNKRTQLNSCLIWNPKNLTIELGQAHDSYHAEFIFDNDGTDVSPFCLLTGTLGLVSYHMIRSEKGSILTVASRIFSVSVAYFLGPAGTRYFFCVLVDFLCALFVFLSIFEKNN